MIEKVAGPAIPHLLTATEWRRDVRDIAKFVGLPAATRINAHVAALEEEIDRLSKNREGIEGPGVRRLNR